MMKPLKLVSEVNQEASKVWYLQMFIYLIMLSFDHVLDQPYDDKN